MKIREDGFNAGIRRVGTLALYLIPAALGIGASIWLGVMIGTRQFLNTLSQEQRRAVYVGAEKAPKGKLDIETPNTRCVKIDRVDLDGSVAAVYFHNACNKTQRSIQIKYQLVSPNGTLLAEGGSYSGLLDGPDALRRDEAGEAVLDGYQGVKLDKRAAKIRFTAESIGEEMP